MHLELLLLAAPFSSALVARSDPVNAAFCSTEPTAEERADIQSVQTREDFSLVSSNTTIEVPLYFHVVSASTRPEDGNIPEPVLRDQVRVLNADYAPHNIQFSLQGITRTVNIHWAVLGESDAMKRALRRGDYRTLNVYFLNTIPDGPDGPDGLAGRCTLPRKLEEGEDISFDGCEVMATTVPGGSAPRLGLGHTTTHEVGHWFGLLHTFGSNCETDEDMVDDTPIQAGAEYDCHVGRDSCPNAPGLDPIHNYMGYSGDKCLEEFTVGQGRLMRNVWNTLRLQGS